MTKKLTVLLASIALIFQIGGCTSKKAQDESEIIENADVAKIEAEADQLGSGLDDVSADLGTATDDASLQAALGEAPADATATLDSTSAQLDATASNLDAELNASSAAATDAVNNATDIAAAPTLDENSLNDIPPPDAALSGLTETPVDVSTSSGLDTASTEPAPLVEEPVAVAETSTKSTWADTSPSYDEPAKPKANNSLKKVALTAPYQSDMGWVNTVYVVRPGEKLKDISTKIFGSDKSKELKKIAENAYLKSRSAKAGDKIYYVSPNRPDDSTKTLLFYEDVGMMPETYVAKKGDRLKKIGKELLGHDKGWVELWTSNSVESKDKLAEGEMIRFWRSASSINEAPQQMAQAPQMMDQGQMAPPPPMPDNSMPPPPDQGQMAMNNPNDMMPPPPAPPEDMPPPPMPDQAMQPPTDPAMAGMTGDVPPPPPPDATAPPKKKFTPDAAAAGDEEPAQFLDQDQMMSAAAVGVLLLAIILIRIRARKKKMAEQAMAEHGVS